MGEMCDAEENFGVEFGNDRTSGVRMVAAMLWIAISRVDPTITVEDIRALPPEVFETFAGMEDDAGPPDVKQNSTNGAFGSGSSTTGDDPDETPVVIGPGSLDAGATLASTTSAT